MTVASDAKSKSPWMKIALLVAVVAAIGIMALNMNQTRELVASLSTPSVEAKSKSLVELVGDRDDTVRLTQDDSARLLGVRVAEVRRATEPQPLNLPGTLFLDPNRLIHVHSRFGGEAISIGKIDDGKGKGVARSLQYGDRVKKGQLLAVVWSKEIGEKKSELMDASSKLEASKVILARLEKLAAGIVTERAKDEARLEVESNVIAVARAERTLRSWRMTDDEIKAIYDELHSIKQSKHSTNPEIEKRWAEIEVRAAIDGVIVEKSFNVGDMVDPNDDLFKIADLSRLQVLANIYEEDLGAVRALKPEARRWTIDLKSDRLNNRIPGTFELIGSVIDPAQRTGVVMGWIDNSDGKLAVGQFITATIELPYNPQVVAVPRTALIEEGDSSTVFVEVDRAQREYARRKVSVVRRGIDTIYVDSAPSADGDKPLQVGERVVVSGVLSLGGELAIIRTAASKRG
ncbi:MAG: efflux RND transporter periplasmic adaptor subunit [Planctomycetia bacterium]|nr:efflux RND transporter periplasmic adaptor subunit [Planctomycetia bacterium]